MKTKLVLFSIFIFVMSLVPYNCSKDKEEEPIIEEPNYTGNWQGTTSNDQDVYFRVNNNNEIDSVKLNVVVYLPGSGNCTGLYLYKTNLATINENGSFEIELQGIQMAFTGGIKAKLTGKFSSESNCTGNFASIDVYSLECGGHYIVGLGPEISSFTWSAKKQ